MTKIALCALALSCALMPLAAGADTSPLVNRVIVQQALQQQLQNQLNTQAVQLQAQQELSRATVQSGLEQQMQQLQYLELQQQLNLIRLQDSAVRSSHSHKIRHHSH